MVVRDNGVFAVAAAVEKAVAAVLREETIARRYCGVKARDVGRIVREASKKKAVAMLALAVFIATESRRVVVCRFSTVDGDFIEDWRRRKIKQTRCFFVFRQRFINIDSID